jgi:Tol biopolymer transport system component
MRQFNFILTVLSMVFYGCRQPEIDPSLLLPTITVDEALRPISLSSRIVDNTLEVTITPQGLFVCCCAPCTQFEYKPTKKYEVQIATSDAGPYQFYTTLNVGSEEKQQLAASTFVLPENLTRQPLAVRVVVIGENRKAGYVRAIMNSTSPVLSSITALTLSDEKPNLGLNFNGVLSQIAFATYVQDATYALIPTLYLADYSRGQLTNKRVLTPGGFGGTFSRNGRQFAYLTPARDQNSTRTLVIHDIATAANRIIELQGNLWISSYSWSPDGQWIAFLEQNNEYSRLWKVNLTTGKQEPLTAAMPLSGLEGIWQGTIDWSPDGNSIGLTYKSSYSATDFQVGIAQFSPTTGKLLSTMNTLTGCVDKNPSYSPDGKQVAFISSRTDNQQRQFSVWIRNLSTNQLRHVRLPDSYQVSDNFTPRWTGDDGLICTAYDGVLKRYKTFLVTL